MKKLLLAFAAAALMLGFISTAAAGPVRQGSTPVIVWRLSSTVVSQTIGKVSATVSLRVNGRSQLARITSAVFVPLDGLGAGFGNTCGLSLKGTTSSSTTRFTSPHPGAYALRFTVVARSASKIAGKVRTATFRRSVVLGGTGFECQLVSNPPSADQVCEYGYPGHPSGGGWSGCGAPVANSPFWVGGRPTVDSNGLVTAPHIASTSGYCWWDSTTAERREWLGAPVTDAVGWLCSNGYILQAVVHVYFAPPGSSPSTPEECEVSWDGGGGHPGSIKAFSLPVPNGLGGAVSIEWGLIVLDSNKRSLGYEMSDAVPVFSGSVDGCSYAAAHP